MSRKGGLIKNIFKLITFFFYLTFFTNENIFAACGGTTRTWNGVNTTWNTASNWSGGNVPDTATEDVVMTSTGFNASFATSYSLGCVDVQAGTINGTTNNVTMTITGDYFLAPYQNSLNFTRNTFLVNMAGSAPQTFEAVDDIRDLTISNTTTVTLKNNFRILSNLAMVGSGTTIVEGIVQATSAVTIPVGHTVIIKNNGGLFLASSLTVNGTLVVEGGGQLQMANGRTLSIPAGGRLKLLGSAGNAAMVSSFNTSSWFIFALAGSLEASYAVISRASANGMNVTGTIFSLDHTDFRGMLNNGYGMTFGAAANIPATLDSIGFFNDDGVANPKNINANVYNKTSVTINNTSGDVSGAAFELDPNSKINWGSNAPTEINITNDAEINEPTATLAINTAVTFAEFAFTLSQNDLPTDITQVVLTMTGTATMADLASVQVFRDVNGNCNYDAVTDTQIGGNLIFSGNPLKATVAIPAGSLTTSSPSTQACLLVRATSGPTPIDQHTLGFAVVGSSDITNSKNYAVSATSGPPLLSRSTILVNTAFSTWTGNSSTAWNATANWTPATLPSAVRDCKIGLSTRIALVNITPINCANATLQTNGTLDFNNLANNFQISNSIQVSSGFNFLNAVNGNITMQGSVNQNLSFGTPFPGNLIINNSGATGNNTATVEMNSVVNGNLTCTTGVLEIPNGVSLTILGNIIVQSSCTLSIAAGGTLIMANGKTLTVNAGGVLKIVGSSGAKAKITSTGGAAGYNIIVNGTIKAQNYIFDHLNTGGVSIEAGATIDSLNFLQDGTFSYPAVTGTTFLKLKRQIPGNALSNMIFSSLGSSSTGVVNINTTGAAAGTLSISNYSGDLSGPSFDTSPVYTINWTGLLNTIAITNEATSPTPLLTGTTYNMGRFGFQQVLAGASYSDADVTTIKLTLTGTGNASDVSAVRLYANPTCSGSSGVLIGSGVFSGNPSVLTFTIAPGALVVPAALVTTTKICAYVEYDIAINAIDGNTVGVRLTASSDFINSKIYPVSTSTVFPVTMGAAGVITAPLETTWTGAISTAWAVAGNWTGGVPSSTLNCIIPNVANDPIISAGTGACKNMTITNGILVVNAGATLDIYGDLTKSGGTLTTTGTLSIKDGGLNINHNLFSNTTLTNLTLAKTGTGKVIVNQAALTINTLNFSSATTTLEIPNGNKLVLPLGVTVGAGILKIASGGILEIGNAQTITVAGGTFSIAGVIDGFPQNIANKGIVQVTGGGANRYNFTATSGVLNLVGFQFDRLGLNGLNVGGTTNITNFSGGQFTNLSPTFASVKAIQLNNTGLLPATATNIGWTWGNFNSFNPATVNTPANTQAYKLISSTGCGNKTIDFTGWTGDWYETTPTFDVSTKVSTTINCTINLGASASAVNILFFDAVSFNKAVDLRWRTNAERMHLGFNVYRADMFSARFVQINKNLIRNLKNPGSNSASYRFVDYGVENDQRYFYYIEDVETSGKKVLHGPVTGMAQNNLGAPPLDNPDENSEINSDAPSRGDGEIALPENPSLPQPTFEDLGGGIKILSKTKKSIRIEIKPENPIFTTSLWNSLYQDVKIAGYSKMTTAGVPELPEKEILIEVQPDVEKAEVHDVKIEEISMGAHLVSPAPHYLLNGEGVLKPHFFPEENIYNESKRFPEKYFGVETNLILANKKKFLKIKINPLALNPVEKSIEMAREIVLDIGLDGNSWEVTPPDVGSFLGPYAISNVLRMDIKKSGIYEVSYADLINYEVEGPFKNTNSNEWRLYYKDREIPLEIHSLTGSFSGNDFFRFFVPYQAELESLKNQLILSPINLKTTSMPPMRIKNIDANPVNRTLSNEVLTKFTKTFEENKKFIDGFSLEDSLDHFFYASLVNFAGMDALSINAELPEIDPSNIENVVVKYFVRAKNGIFGNPIKHHVVFSLNGKSEGAMEFSESQRTTLTFEIPADRFVNGNNSLDLKVTGKYAPANDFDFVFVDKVEVTYNGFKYADKEMNIFSLADSLRVHTISNFLSSDIIAYDITDLFKPKKLSHMEIEPEANQTFNAHFFVDGNVDEENLKHFIFSTKNNLLRPTGLSLNPGIDESLRSSLNRADLIVYGDASLLEAATELVERRRAQGLEVMTITPDQIYGEFSYGLTSSLALKDFMQMALKNWEKAPDYLLILGDGTYDPKDYNVNQLKIEERSALEKSTLPAPLIPGRFLDFSSDNFFVTKEGSHLPQLSVGRIPTNDPKKIKDYIEKIKAYEDEKELEDNGSKKISFFSDEDTGDYEKFNERTQMMMSEAKSFSTHLFDRKNFSNKEEFKNKIIDEFSQSPLLISMMGHGAFDRYGDDVFDILEARKLKNQKYPIVATWNCENAYFYDANKTYKSLGEELIFNQNGGAIVYMGSTTQTTPSAQAKFGQSYFTQLEEALKHPRKTLRFGDLLFLTKLALGESSYEKDIVNSFSIIGDPTLVMDKDLFSKKEFSQNEALKNEGKKSGFFGCTARADDGASHAPWSEGFLDWIIVLFAIFYSSRKIQKFL